MSPIQILPNYLLPGLSSMENFCKSIHNKINIDRVRGSTHGQNTWITEGFNNPWSVNMTTTTDLDQIETSGQFRTLAMLIF